MEIDLILLPVGPKFYVFKRVASDIELKKILLGSLHYVARMVVATILMCLFSGLAKWLPEVFTVAAL